MKRKSAITIIKRITLAGVIIVVVGAAVAVKYFINNVPIKAVPATAQGILDAAVAGDTILLGSGVYSNLIVFNSGTAEKHIRVECASGASITGDDYGILLDGDYLELSGCEFKNVFEHAILSMGKHILIKSNIVHDNVTKNGANGNCTLIPAGGWASGISIKQKTNISLPSSEDVVVRSNTVYHNCGEGIASTRTGNVVIEDNLVYDNYSVNIYIDNSFLNAVKNNTIRCSDYVLREGRPAYGIGTGQEEYSGWGQQLHDISIVGNTVTGCFDGISIYATHGSTRNILVDGNIVSACNRYAITNRATVMNMIVSNNQYCAAGGMSFSPEEGVTLINNLPVDAQ